MDLLQEKSLRPLTSTSIGSKSCCAQSVWSSSGFKASISLQSETSGQTLSSVVRATSITSQYTRRSSSELRKPRRISPIPRPGATLLPWVSCLIGLFLILNLLPGTLRAESYFGTVAGITDGDTIKLLAPDKNQVKVRLADIDTPERGQPFGTKARQILADKIFQKQVRVEKVIIDRYKCLADLVFLGDRYNNAEMVADGAARVYRKYNDAPELLALEVSPPPEDSA